MHATRQARLGRGKLVFFFVVVAILLGIASCPQRFRLSDGSWAWGATPPGEDPPQPRLADVEHLGCTITGPEGAYFRTVVWADYFHEKHTDCRRARLPDAPHCFSTLYSMREKRSRAMKDCDQWLERTNRAISKLRTAK